MKEQRDTETQTPTTRGCPQPGPSLLPGLPRLRWEAQCALGDTPMVVHAARGCLMLNCLPTGQDSESLPPPVAPPPKRLRVGTQPTGEQRPHRVGEEVAPRDSGEVSRGRTE